MTARPRVATLAPPLIELDRVSVRFGEVLALDALSLATRQQPAHRDAVLGLRQPATFVFEVLPQFGSAVGLLHAHESAALVERSVPRQVIVGGQPQRRRTCVTGRVHHCFEQHRADALPHRRLAHRQLLQERLAIAFPQRGEAGGGATCIERQQGIAGRDAPRPAGALGQREFVIVRQVEEQARLLEEHCGIGVDGLKSREIIVNGRAQPQRRPGS